MEQVVDQFARIAQHTQRNGCCVLDSLHTSLNESEHYVSDTAQRRPCSRGGIPRQVETFLGQLSSRLHNLFGYFCCSVDYGLCRIAQPTYGGANSFCRVI